MPQRPEKSLEELHESTIDAKTEKYIRRLSRRGHRYLGASALLAFVITPVTAYSSDVIYNYHQIAEASISISERAGPLSELNNDAALAILNGFGTQNANDIIKYQGEALQNITDGSLYSVNYQNAPLDHQAIANQLIEMAEDNGLDRISIVGYSAGGNTGANVALRIIEQSEVDVPAIIFNLTPDGTDGLHPDKQNDLQFIDTISSIPGIKYSKHARFIMEMAVRLEHNPGSNFWKTFNQTSDAVYNDKLPGFKLMIDQAMDVVESDIRSNLLKIAEITEKENKLKPVVVYLSAEPGADYMVDNQVSSKNICSYAQEAGLECIIIEVPNIKHNRPDISSDEYLKAIITASDKVNNALNSAQMERDYKNLPSANHIN